MFNSSAPLLLLIALYSLQRVGIGAFSLNCFICCRDPDDPQPAPQDYLPCKNRPPGQPDWAPDGGWACMKVNFPTVECLAADMKACGNVGDNSIFYSFGARTDDTRPFRDQLNPRGMIFNEALDEELFKISDRASDRR